MGVRRKTVLTGRKTLFRTCDICGRPIVTTADTPFVRQILRDGRQITVYYCSETCKKASYKYSGWFDGKAEERRKEREENRDIREKNKRYYAAHAEQMRERARRYRSEHPEEVRMSNEFYRKKRKLLAR